MKIAFLVMFVVTGHVADFATACCGPRTGGMCAALSNANSDWSVLLQKATEAQKGMTEYAEFITSLTMRVGPLYLNESTCTVGLVDVNSAMEDMSAILSAIYANIERWRDTDIPEADRQDVNAKCVAVESKLRSAAVELGLSHFDLKHWDDWQSDELYKLGRFVVDDEQRKKIQGWIDEYQSKKQAGMAAEGRQVELGKIFHAARKVSGKSIDFIMHIRDGNKLQ